MPTILKLELPVEQIKRTETEKEKGSTNEKEVTLKENGITVKLQGNPERLEKFVRGQKVTITVTQSQTQLIEEETG